MNTFRAMQVWQKAMDLVIEVYRYSDAFPQKETFGLTAQMRRCAVSIPSNLAEGFGRKSSGEMHHFACISVGSLFELQTQLEISFRLSYLNKDDFEHIFAQTREIERMLASLARKQRDG